MNKFVIYGAGNNLLKNIKKIEGVVDVDLIIDNDKNKQNIKIDDIEIIPLSRFDSILEDTSDSYRIINSVTNESFLYEIFDHFRRKGFKRNYDYFELKDFLKSYTNEDTKNDDIDRDKNYEVFDVIHDPSLYFPVFCTIKEETYENINLSPVYRISDKGGVLSYTIPPIKIYEIENGRVSDGSDIIVTNIGIIHDCLFSETYSKALFCDWDLKGFSDDYSKAYVKSKRERVDVPGKTFSMLGRYGNLWSHFLIQFLPKLLIANDSGLFDGEFNILIPPTNDKNIKEALQYVFEGNDNINIISVEDNIEYRCEKLYYMTPVTFCAKDGTYAVPADSVMSEVAVDSLHRFVNKVLSHRSNTEIYDKIYLPRRDTVRKVLNWKEIEHYFNKKGYKILEPSEYSLVDKFTLFNNAKEIAGPFSSAFLNIVASEDANILILTNIERTTESFISSLGGESNIILQVTGQDIHPIGPHSDFYIPVEKIDDAYRSLNKY